MYDEDTIKEIKAEERAYEQWERETKNFILSLASVEKKRELWSKYFPTPILLEAGEVY